MEFIIQSDILVTGAIRLQLFINLQVLLFAT